MPKLIVQTPVVLTTVGRVELLLDELHAPDGNYQLEVYIERADLLRNAMAAWQSGPAKTSGGMLRHTQDLIAPARPGLHFVRVGLKDVQGHELVPPVTSLRAVFKVSEHLATVPVGQAEIAAAERARKIAIEKEFQTPASGGRGALFEVYVFCAATLIHGEHNFEGFTIYPLQSALTEESLRQAMNVFTLPRLGITIHPEPTLSAQFQQSSPAYVIGYHRVRATSHQDALEFAQMHADHVNDVLGMQRGQKATAFGVMSIRRGAANDIQVGYYYPGYRGNLLAPMFPGEIEAHIEANLPKVQSSPWARLLVGNFADATAERDAGIQHMRYWSLLELMAKRHITSDREPITYMDGSPIYQPNSTRPVLTKHARAKVYAHLKGLGIGDQGGDLGEPTLWDVLGALYVVRNSVAHTGEYTPDLGAMPNTDERRAAQVYPTGALMRDAREYARMALYRELAALP